MPTLIIWGAEDHVTAPSFGEQFRDAIQNSQLVEIERTGHFPQEEKPDESAAALRAFLRINAQATPQTAQDSEALEPPSP
jgi:pimeloyl-ACP methyl ester carboxylesterase